MSTDTAPAGVCSNCGDPITFADPHVCIVTPGSPDPFGYRERINEEAQRQLEMLRVTLTERIAECQALQWGISTEDNRRGHAKEVAYRDVLSLLGPEPAWWNDPDNGEPF